MWQTIVTSKIRGFWASLSSTVKCILLAVIGIIATLGGAVLYGFVRGRQSGRRAEQHADRKKSIEAENDIKKKLTEYYADVERIKVNFGPGVNRINAIISLRDKLIADNPGAKAYFK